MVVAKVAISTSTVVQALVVVVVVVAHPQLVVLQHMAVKQVEPAILVVVAVVVGPVVAALAVPPQVAQVAQAITAHLVELENITAVAVAVPLEAQAIQEEQAEVV
jgi:hypothetical protein